MRSEDLRYFLAVASTGRLGPASDLTGISQPGLTKAIARLEAELGASLFERTGRGMQLTELGRAFEGRAMRMTAELSEAMQDARAMAPAGSVLRVGTAPSAEPLLAETCSRLLLQRPLLRVELLVQITDYLEIAVGSGRIDLAVVSRLREFPEELAFAPFGQDEVRIAASVDHPLARLDRPLQFRELAGQEWVLPRPESAMRRHLDQAFATRALPPPLARLECEFGMSMLSLAATGGLLTVVTPYTFKLAPPGGLRPLQVEDFQWQRDLGVLTRRAGARSALAQDFLAALVDGPARRWYF